MGDRITEDLVELDSPPASGTPGRLVAALIGIGIGFALAVVTGFLGGETPVQEGGIKDGGEDLLPTGELMPTFEAGFSAVVLSDGQGMDLVDWPPAPEGRPTTRTRLPFGGVNIIPALSPSGQFVAAGVPLRDTFGDLLYAGPPGAIRTVGSSVTGFAWHDSNQVLLGWVTRDTDGEIGLWTSVGGTQTVQHLTTISGMPDAVLVGHGDWGWALESEGQVFVVDDLGMILRAHPGEFQDSLADGHLLIRRGGQPIVVSPDGSERSFQLGAEVDDVVELLNGVGEWWSSAFVDSPQRIAILGSRGLALVNDSGSEILQSNPALFYRQRPAIPGVAIGDGHVGYARDTGGAVIVDLETGDEFEVLTNETVRAIEFR